jgi:MFS family permease
MATASTPPTSLLGRDTPVPGARAALILLIAINLFNYIDRQVLAAVEPEIALTFFPPAPDPVTGKMIEPPGSGFWMGTLASAFLVSFMLFAPVFGALANHMSRWWLVGIGVLVWTLASGGSGLATTFLILFLTRCFVGIGEAVYGPVAPTMLSDLYPEKRRGAIIAWFYTAIPVGGAIGYVLGDALKHHWPLAFYAVVPPGIALAVVCFFMPEPKRGQSDEHAANLDRKVEVADYWILAKTPSYVLNCLGMTAMVFAMGGMAFWVPRYLDYKEATPLFGMSARAAFGPVLALMGLAATLLGGWAGDKLRGVVPGSYFFVSGLAMVIAFPMSLLMIALPFPWAWLPLAAFAFLLFFNTGPTNAILANVTHPLLRAPGFAINILVIHLFGDVVSPPIMGAIKDVSNLDWAFGLVSVTVLIGGILWLWGMFYLERDTKLAPTRLGSPETPLPSPGGLWSGDEASRPQQVPSQDIRPAQTNLTERPPEERKEDGR